VGCEWAEYPRLSGRQRLQCIEEGPVGQRVGVSSAREVGVRAQRPGDGSVGAGAGRRWGLAPGAAPVYGVRPYAVLGEESVVLGSVRIHGLSSWTVGLLAVAVGVSSIAATCGIASGAEPRRYELVSPPDKAGGEVMSFSSRTRAANDGDAVGFASLVGFGDARGTGLAVEYLAQRRPELGRWVTHAVTPTVPTSRRTSGVGS
jgi:hypothetical protein